MKPTIGRIVHYHPVVAYGPDATPEEMAKPLPLLTHAAIVVDISERDGVEYPVLRVLGRYHGEDWTVDCSPGGYHPDVLGRYHGEDWTVDCSPGGYHPDGVRQSETPTMGCWNWPPRV
jgi:hypothetical protein